MSTRFVTTVRAALLASRPCFCRRRRSRQDAPTAGDTRGRGREHHRRHRLSRVARTPRSTAKRDSDSQIDVIVAEDIAKFPDPNLAESLQRIPGVAIQRDAGEGRAITVRGLGPQFTRVRVNGMEAIATSTDGATANRERGVRLQRVRVRAVQLDRGPQDRRGLARRRLAWARWSTSTPATRSPTTRASASSLSAQARYNDLSKTSARASPGWSAGSTPTRPSASRPRSPIRSTTLSSSATTPCAGRRRGDSADGTRCCTRRASPATTTSRARRATQAGLAFHPRIPRYGLVEHDRERLGADRLVQWEPTESTKISIDGLYSTLQGNPRRVLGRSAAPHQRAADRRGRLHVYDSNNNMVTGTFNNAWVRTEHYLARERDRSSTRFGGSGTGDRRQVHAPAARRQVALQRRHPGRGDADLRRPRLQRLQLRLHRHGAARC